MNTSRATAVVSAGQDEFFICVSVKDMLSDTMKSVRLTQRLSEGDLNMHQGMSFDSMGFFETLMVRGAREIRLREFNDLYREVKAYRDDFRAKAKLADPLLVAYAEGIPVARTRLEDVQADTVLSTTNHDWTDNMGRAYLALMDCVDDVGRMLAEYWDALDRISDKMNARRDK